MITSTHSATAANSLTDFTAALPANGVSSAGSTDPFAQQLVSVLEQYLSKNGNGASSEVDIKISQSQVSAGSQFTVTITEPGSSSPATSGSSLPATSGTSLMDANKTIGTALTPAISSPAAVASASDVSTVDKSKMTPDDAYWAEQPAAVQALRDMPDDQRATAAMDLAKKGYAIDVPIMVWGWDPLTTMVERQNYGYTWVPSGLGTPVELPPGLSFPGLPSYDPNNPPAGSIKVTTDFAIGTNMQNVFIDPATIQASLSTSAAQVSS